MVDGCEVCSAAVKVADADAVLLPLIADAKLLLLLTADVQTLAVAKLILAAEARVAVAESKTCVHEFAECSPDAATKVTTAAKLHLHLAATS